MVIRKIRFTVRKNEYLEMRGGDGGGWGERGGGRMEKFHMNKPQNFHRFCSINFWVLQIPVSTCDSLCVCDGRSEFFSSSLPSSPSHV